MIDFFSPKFIGKSLIIVTTQKNNSWMIIGELHRGIFRQLIFNRNLLNKI